MMKRSLVDSDDSSDRCERSGVGLQPSRAFFEKILEAIPEPTMVIGLDYGIVFANRAAREMAGADDLMSGCLKCHQVSHHRAIPCEGENDLCPLRRVAATKAAATVVHTHFDSDGREVYVEITAAPVFDESGEVIQIIESCRDITERIRSRRFLEIGNRHARMQPLLEEFVSELREFTGCPAVGIRILDDHGGIAYYAYDGFSQAFYELESPLCIEVIRGTADSSSPLCTEGGSIHVNSTTHFVSNLSENEKGQFRNTCHEFGYESVALVPIRLGDRNIGLIQAVDPRENAVSSATVEALERVAMQLGTAIQRVRAEESLRAAHEDLETRVQKRTAELADANQALQDEIAERTRLEKEILYVGAHEQQRIGQELHDGLGQELTGLGFLAKSLHRRLRAQGLPEAETAADLDRGIPEVLGQVRGIVRGLLPLELGAEDLLPALQSLTAGVEERTDISCRLESSGPLEDIDNDKAVQLYRIAQEAVTNAVKHGQAQHVTVALKSDRGQITLDVSDDGIGIDPDAGGVSGSGLHIMRYRARAIGGTLDVNRRPGGGTRVTCVLTWGPHDGNKQQP